MDIIFLLVFSGLCIHTAYRIGFKEGYKDCTDNVVSNMKTMSDAITPDAKQQILDYLESRK